MQARSGDRAGLLHGAMSPVRVKQCQRPLRATLLKPSFPLPPFTVRFLRHPLSSPKTDTALTCGFSGVDGPSTRGTPAKPNRKRGYRNLQESLRRRLASSRASASSCRRVSQGALPPFRRRFCGGAPSTRVSWVKEHAGSELVVSGSTRGVGSKPSSKRG